MAIDSKAKRASVQAYTLGLMRPPPTGSPLNASRRATVAWFYSGVFQSLEAIPLGRFRMTMRGLGFAV